MLRKYRLRRRAGWLVALFVVILVLVTWSALFARKTGWAGQAKHAVESHQPGLYSIAYFVDGDTIAVNMNGQVEKVRFIGIDTPETHKPNTPVQCYGPAAAAYTKATIDHNQVRLVSDPLSTDRDRYDRLLRYVYLSDNTDVNEELVRSGYAFYYPYFPFTKAEQFAADEQQAQAAHAGLWSHCHPTPTDAGGYKMDEPEPANS